MICLAYTRPVRGPRALMLDALGIDKSPCAGEVRIVRTRIDNVLETSPALCEAHARQCEHLVER